MGARHFPPVCIVRFWDLQSGSYPETFGVGLLLARLARQNRFGMHTRIPPMGKPNPAKDQVGGQATSRQASIRGIAANALTQRMLACRAVSNSAPRSLLAVERHSVVARELVERNRRLPRYLGDDIRHLGSKRFHHVLKYFRCRSRVSR
jgi:hypothetical protein